MNEMRFNGSDYDPEEDDERLSQQHIRIRSLMLDGAWRTLAEIAQATGDPPASVSAQLRHLRKKRFGAFTVDKRARGERKSGLFEYRVLPPEEGAELPTESVPVRLTKMDIDEMLVEIRELVRISKFLGCEPHGSIYRLIVFLEQRRERADNGKGRMVRDDVEESDS